MSPNTKSKRHNLSPLSAKATPEKTPLMPAMRPLKTINITAESPINAPPISAERGVKFSIAEPFSE